jgi:eukaryotic-like serine/threonine-protein kinase
MLKPGMIISERYEIIDKVGSGGMADVYKAKDLRLNRFVAIKVLKPEYSSDKSFVNKFRGEAQSAAGLSHPNIVNVYDVGDDGSLHFIVMELVEGITLKRFIERKGKLEIKEAVGIGIQIAQGMEAAHDNHIIHRDIKPQNIIISRDGKVKVTDFGIAKATNSNTITSNAMGSVHYLSPEQARGGYSDEKSDIYSLGVTLYEMLSGKVPFAGDNTVSVALLHIQGEAMPLRELDPEIPVSIDKIVQKCMQKRPERRYHSASELIADLKKAITNPDGDFVQIPAFVASDSPTINISDDLSKIKSGTYIDEDMRSTKNLGVSKANDEDDEDLDTVDSKVEKVFFIGTIVAAVVLAVVIFIAVGWLLLHGGNGKNNDDGETSVTPIVSVTPTPPYENPDGEDYTVPNVVGYTKDDAVSIINTAAGDDVFIKFLDDQYSDTVEAGKVMKQFPEAGEPSKTGSTIMLTLSKGKQSIEVPNIAGLTEAKAKTKLAEYNLDMDPQYKDSDTIEKGHVISTDPVIGTSVKSGDTITVIISNGTTNTVAVVPNLIDLTKNAAITALSDAGLELGDVSLEASTDYVEGHITYQSYSEGESVTKGTKVDITLSTGSGEYTGKVNIDLNPFENNPEYVAGEQAEIILTVVQDGQPGVDIYDEMCDIDDFPLQVEFTMPSPSDCTITMSVDGTDFTLNGDTSAYTWTTSLSEEN